MNLNLTLTFNFDLTLALVACFTLLLAPSCRADTGALDSPGGKRHFILHLPYQKHGDLSPAKSPVSQAKLPLMIMLHGGGQNGRLGAFITGMNKIADRERFVVCYPDGSGRFRRFLLTWNAFDCCGFSSGRKVDDSGYLASLIDSLLEKYPIDRSRVYLAGFSNGAMMAYRVACEHPEKIAAIAVVGGSMSGKERQPPLPVPALIIHGTKDKHVPIAGGAGKLAKWGYPVNKKSLEYALEFWKENNRCNETPHIDTVGKEHWFIYSNAQDKPAVELCTIDGARHAWPGGHRVLLYTDRPYSGFSASQKAWDFLSQHKREAVGLSLKEKNIVY